MIRISVALLFVLNFNIIAFSQQDVEFQLASGQNKVQMNYQNRTRTAIVCIPKSKAMPDGGWPLILMLHGAGGSSKNVLEQTGWAETGEKEGFVTIFPNGTPSDEAKPESFLRNPQTWNSGGYKSLAAGGESAIAKNIDDVGFLTKLVETVSASTSINPNRVYVCGHSNGAAMAYRLASEKSKMFAAVGVMASCFFLENKDIKGFDQSVSLLQIVGDKDPFTPINGGKAGIGRKKMDLPPALESPKLWAIISGIDSSAVKTDENNLFIKRWWASNRHDISIESIIVKGHGHGYLWPGGRNLPALLIGPTKNSLNATATFWEFFKAHPKAAISK
ncbi:MAG: PHB depolymerase family esterase [Bacteroidota bacterium]|nr:PHB depolymerase family esterase [Bacteroidota bacterium]